MMEKTQKFPDFDIALQIKNDNFISSPRQFQRNWILNQALNEFADDLIHLDKISKRFVPGVATKLYNDLSESKTQSEGSKSILEDQKIMEDWQIPLMKAMANFATETHSDVLKVGFGRGVSATFIHELGVKSHTIIECDDDVVKAFYEWKSHYPEEIRLIHGKWQDVVNKLGIYDGIFFHTNILNDDELVEYVAKSITFAEHFFPTAASHLKKGGIFTYLTHEIDSFSRRHQRLVFKYFSSLTLKVVEQLSVPKDSKDLWWADSMVVAKVIK